MPLNIEDYAIIGDCETAAGATWPSTGFAGHVSILPLVSPISSAQRTTDDGRLSAQTPALK
jgi:hypothetical protein